MIDTTDYYNKFGTNIANCNKFVEGDGGLPLEECYIGELESVNGHKLPAIFSFADYGNLVFLNNPSNRSFINHVIEAISLRLMAALPANQFRFTLYDGVGLGSSIISLSNVNSKIINRGEIISDPDEFKKTLREIQAHIPNVIQKVLSLKYHDKTLYDYNTAEPDHAVPYQFIVIADFPQTLSKEHYGILETIVKNGRKAGVFVIMSLDASIDNNDNYNSFSCTSILDYCTTIYEHNDRFYIKRIGDEAIWNKFSLKLDSGFLDRIESILNYINYKEDSCKRVQTIDLESKLPDQNFWWSKESSQGISIPFGMTLQSEIVSLSISQISGQNVAVVVGIPGSGKSVFLNTIITSCAVQYSPDELELYLIDFSGVEFNIYADYLLPQAKVVAPESEREFGISVLRAIKEEGNRRMELFRSAGVNNITDFKQEHPDEKLPRILIIIDEFQKFFEDDTDNISIEAENIIRVIVQEYRKFGINLILATQSISKYVNKIELGMIANRVAFEWKEDDTHYIFNGVAPINMINEPGDCVYNSKAGKPNGNIGAKSFFVSQKQLSHILERILAFAEAKNKFVKDKIIFHSDASAIFENNKNLRYIKKEDSPNKVKVYLGESIAISDEDVHIELQRGTNSNILIIGGQNGDAAVRIAINSVRSIVLAHNDNKANFFFFNYISKEDPYSRKPEELYGNIPFNHDFVEIGKQEECLRKIKAEIERRQKDDLVQKRHVYLSFYNFQFAYNFNKQSDWDLSEIARLLTYILEQGPLVGIFTILQVDELSSLVKMLDRNSLDRFNHRVALQMSENDSISIIEDRTASRIFVENKPSSKNRAFYYNKSNNIKTKFKPYSI